MSTADIKATVRQKYGEAALQVSTGKKTSCCGTGSCATDAADPSHPTSTVRLRRTRFPLRRCSHH